MHFKLWSKITFAPHTCTAIQVPRSHKQALPFGDVDSSQPLTISFLFLQQDNMEMEGPNKDEVDLEQVFLGEKSFTFPSDQLGRLHDHTGMHRLRTCDLKIEQFRFN